MAAMVRARWLARWLLLATLAVVALLALNRRGGGSRNLLTEAEDAEFMVSVALRMSARRLHLRAACDALAAHNDTAHNDTAHNDTAHDANPWEFLVDRKHHLVWCNVFKAASTSWMYNFNVLAGYEAGYLARTKQVPLSLARARYPRVSLAELRAALEDSVSFLIVRHPFERLVSAYRDKIAGSVALSPHRALANHIVQVYRDPALLETQRQDKHNPPTFPEFVAYLLDEHGRGKALDMHWTPVTQFCTPCHIDFTVVAKFETLEEDQRYLIALAELQTLIRPQWRNPSKGGAADAHAPAQFRQLTPAQIRQLHDIYRDDFALFDYSLDGYLDAAQ